MSGLMEILEQLNSSPVEASYAIVPTVLLPLAFLSTGISIFATYVAGLFGVKLKAEGPKKLLEMLLKPKLLITALILNALIYGGFEGWSYLRNGPVPLRYQSFKNTDILINKPALKATKELHWQQNIEEGIFTEGVVVGNEIFVGSKEGHLFVLDNETGTLKEKIYFGKFLSPRPILYKGFLYFGEGLHKSHHMRVYKFNYKSKKLVSSFKTEGHTEMKAVATELNGIDYLFSSAGGSGLYALDPKTMKLRWNLNKGHMDSYPIVHGKYLYIGTGVPKEDIGVTRALALKIEIKTGAVIWERELPLSSWFSPVILSDQVCFTMGELHVKSNLGGIQCFKHDGTRTKNYFINKPIIGKHLAYKENIVFNDYKGTLYSWNLASGLLNWSIDNHSKKYSFSSSRKLAGDNYVFFNRNGSGIVYNIATGQVLKKLNFNHKESVFADPIILEEGMLVFGLEGNIKKYKTPFF